MQRQFNVWLFIRFFRFFKPFSQCFCCLLFFLYDLLLLNRNYIDSFNTIIEYRFNFQVIVDMQMFIFVVSSEVNWRGNYIFGGIKTNIDYFCFLKHCILYLEEIKYYNEKQNISILRNLLNLLFFIFDYSIEFMELYKSIYKSDSRFIKVIFIWLMPYEYREFTKFNQYKFTKYDQVDLYFFKPKLTGIGIKARYQIYSQLLPKTWEVKQFQVKIIKNYSQIAASKTLMQDWKKYKFNADFTLYTREYFKQNYKDSSQVEIQQRIQQHLRDIDRKIVAIIRDSQQIKEKHMFQNVDLRRWLETEDDLVDIYAIRKQRNKTFLYQQGFVKIIPLFDKYWLPDDIVLKTKAFEHKRQQDLYSLLKKFQIKPAQNVSYPSLLQKKYSGII